MNGRVKHFIFHWLLLKGAGCAPSRSSHRHLSIFRDWDNIPNSAGCFWHCFCRKHSLWASSLCPGQRELLLGHTRWRRAQKPTRGGKVHQDEEISGYWEITSITSLLLHLEVFLEYFPFFFLVMKCNYANEGALIIIHLQPCWQLWGSAGREGTGGHCTPRGTCAFGDLDEQK